MFCNGFCTICMTPCYRGEIKEKKSVVKENLTTDSSPQMTTDIEPVAKYEVVRSLFGKEKVRRIK